MNFFLANIFQDVFGFLFTLLVWTLVIAGVVGFFLAKSYNSLQRLAQYVREAKSNILVNLKKRLELTNKLIDIAQGYAGHEKLVQLKVSQDMAESTSLATTYQRTGVALSQISAVAERFPDLKANGTFLKLMEDIKSIEGDLVNKRESYNATCREYNTARTTIPTIFFSRLMGFTEASYLDFDDTKELDMTKDFVTDDGVQLERIIAGAGAKLLDGSRHFSQKTVELVDKSREMLKQRRYYYLDSEKKTSSPIEIKELELLYLKGTINDLTHVVEVGGKTWIRYSELKSGLGLSDLPPPPPPPES